MILPSKCFGSTIEAFELFVLISYHSYSWYCGWLLRIRAYHPPSLSTPSDCVFQIFKSLLPSIIFIPNTNLSRIWHHKLYPYTTLSLAICTQIYTCLWTLENFDSDNPCFQTRHQSLILYKKIRCSHPLTTSHPILLETNHFESGQNRAKTALGRPKTARSPNLFTRNFGVNPLWKVEFLLVETLGPL